MNTTLLTILLSLTANIAYCFITRDLRSHRRTSNALDGLSSSRKAEWAADDDGPAGFKDVSSQRKLNATFISNLDLAIGSVITKSALHTVSSYMLEFRDEVNEKWMMGFSNYKQKGFPDGLWTNYIEKMIVMDKQQVEVLMKATRASLRARRIPEGGNVMMQYFHDLEPRKIANQIITVREDVSGEMIEDLGAVQLENEEAIRFATTWAREGLPTAERSRRMTRMSGQSESTPGRDGNYIDFDMMITALAIQLVKEDLEKNKDDIALQEIEVLMLKMVSDDISRSALERVLHNTHGPRSFMEQLYYKGITDGVKKSGQKTVNILKVAENLFDTRVSIAKEASKLISLQSMQNRHYYKMIKDHGGFQKLDMATTPKMKFIDLDARAIDEAREDAAYEAKVKVKEEAAAAAALEKALRDTSESEEEAMPDFSEEDSGYSSSSGPMMM